MNIKYIVKENDKYFNINEILDSEFHISSRLKSKLIRNNKIFLNNLSTDTRNSVHIDDVISINLDFEEDNSNIIPKKMNLNIIYEDEWFLIINKPSGIAVHPSILHYEDSLCNGIRYYFDKILLKKKIRPVNRLDIYTSGLVIFAKCEYIQDCLINQMASGVLTKQYIGIVNGILEKKQDIINLPISRKNDSIIERCINKNGQKAITHYKVLKEYGSYSLVECLLETGRTHQIRVHFSAIGHPLLSDTLYGTSSNLISRQALHSYKIKFLHPIKKELITLYCPIPDDMGKLIP